MRVISKFHDYYDYYDWSYAQDRNTWVRKQTIYTYGQWEDGNTVFGSFEEDPISIPRKIRATFTHRNFLSPSYLNFCYSLAHIYWAGNVTNVAFNIHYPKWWPKKEQLGKCVLLEQFSRATREVALENNKELTRNQRYILKQSLKQDDWLDMASNYRLAGWGENGPLGPEDVLTLQRVTRSPLLAFVKQYTVYGVVCRTNLEGLIINPYLAKLIPGIAELLPPRELQQELEMHFDGVICSAETPREPVPNDLNIERHGFDKKVSFRHPTNEQPKKYH